MASSTTSLLHASPSYIHSKFHFSYSSSSQFVYRPNPKFPIGVSSKTSIISALYESSEYRKIRSLVGTTLISKPTSKDETSTRQSLSSNWDISTAAAPTLPRLEELDTTNMLLRQRIIFLGSQVL